MAAVSLQIWVCRDLARVHPPGMRSSPPPLLVRLGKVLSSSYESPLFCLSGAVTSGRGVRQAAGRGCCAAGGVKVINYTENPL